MPVNGFSVGRDISTNINTPTGALPLSLITKFTSKPLTTKKKVKGLDGRTRNLFFPDGWEGTFEVERQDSTVDDFFAAQEAGYYAGLNLLPSSITESITEVSGATTQYQYVNCLFSLEDAGDWAGDETVKQKISFVAEQRIKLA